MVNAFFMLSAFGKLRANISRNPQISLAVNIFDMIPSLLSRSQWNAKCRFFYSSKTVCWRI